MKKQVGEPLGGGILQPTQSPSKDNHLPLLLPLPHPHPYHHPHDVVIDE